MLADTNRRNLEHPSGSLRKTLARLLAPRVLGWLLIPIIAFLVWLPWNVSAYWVRVFTGVFMMATVAQSFNVIMGISGYLAFGHTVFFGLGAYAVGSTMYHWGISFWLSLIFAAIVPSLYALLLGYPLLRLRSQYFATATIGLLFGTRELVINLRKITLGSSGLVVPSVFDTPRAVVVGYYMLMLVLMVISTFVVWLVVRSRFGYGLRAIKSDEDVAQVMGVPTTSYKIIAWVIAAAMAGLAGGLFAGSLGYLAPGNVFNITQVVKAFAMMLIGGAGSVFGPVFGAILLELLSEYLWGSFVEYHMIILGAVIVIITLVLPQGMSDLFARLRTKLAGELDEEGRI
jgi:branched-chain amino acid transport system permease protein